MLKKSENDEELGAHCPLLVVNGEDAQSDNTNFSKKTWVNDL